jgi:membrane protease subunit HflK
MPWNEPGGGGKDPWSKRPSEPGPPDLDELLRKLTGRFGGLFGGGSGGGTGKGRGLPAGLILIGVILFLGWLASGFYIVSAGEAGVELRLGAYKTSTGPGPHWHIPYPIETAELVNVTEVRSVQHKAAMLTQDENIVEVELAVQYVVKAPEEYLFEVRLPDATLRQVMESAMREVVGKSKMDYILAEGRAEIAEDTKLLIQATVDGYQAGLLITTVNMQQAQPPEQVQDAFADAIKAREDEVRFRNEAEAYANGIIPQARGEAARLEQGAHGYRDRLVARAEGETARFTKLLTEYQKAPDVTRERLYLDAVESVLTNSSKVMVDVKGGNNLLYLPLDQLIQGGAGAAMASRRGGSAPGAGGAPRNSMDSRARRTTRLREGR